MDEQRLYAVIKQARAVLSQVPTRDLSEKTRLGYETEVKRLLKKTRHPGELVELAKATTSKSTWYRRRAAIAHVAQVEMERLLKEQARLQRSLVTPEDRATWEKAVLNLQAFLTLHTQAQAVTKWPPEDMRKRRESQKRSLSGLPVGWREALAKRLPGHRFAYLVAAATGCRPDELVKGIKIGIPKDSNSIVAVIQGSKVGEHAGQEQRAIHIELDGVPGSLASQLAEAIGSGNKVVQIPSAKRFSGAIAEAASREWPARKRSVTAYSLRHQFAADRKAEGWSNVDLAEMMGHATDKTVSYYGDRQQRRAGGVTVKRAAASREVKVKTGLAKKTRKRASPG